MIPLALVTGFLGSGKTTWLRRIAEQAGPRRYLFVVNEFANGDVDGGRLGDDDRAEVLAIVGGSIFCTCKITDFRQTLATIAGRIEAGEPVDGVIIEASGIADPRAARRMLRETGLDQRFELRSIMTVVDPGSFMRLLATLPNIRSQVEAADRVILNKTDAFDEATIERTLQAIRELRPNVTIHPTEFGRVTLDPLAPATAGTTDGPYAPCRDPHYHAVDVPVAGPVRFEDFRAAVAEREAAIYRIKGTLPTGPDTALAIDWSGSGWSTREVPADPAALHVTIIGRGGAVAVINELADRLSTRRAGGGTVGLTREGRELGEGK